MKIARTYALYFGLMALIIFLFIMVFLLISVQADWYESLLKQSYFFIPNAFFLLIGCLLIGTITGFVIGYSLQKKTEQIEISLFELEQGNVEAKKLPVRRDEFSGIWQGIEKIRERFKEQAITYQKLTSEKVQWNHQMAEKVLTKERNRLARELHDSVSQQLFAATMLLSAINQSPDPADDKTIKQRKLVEEIVNEAQNEMRALLLHLRPIQLEGKTLKTGMEELLTELTAKLPMQVSWKLQDVRLDKGVEDHLFRILQEAVSNTLRHAKANILEVNMVEIDRNVYLKVMDNGIGFDVKDQKAASYGMTNIKERASEIGGNVKVVSIKGQGTSIEVKVPLLIKEDEVR